MPAPTLEHFRRASRELGAEWPGNDVVRSRHLVVVTELSLAEAVIRRGSV